MKKLLMNTALCLGFVMASCLPAYSADSEVKAAVEKDYNSYLKDLFIHFHTIFTKIQNCLWWKTRPQHA